MNMFRSNFCQAWLRIFLSEGVFIHTLYLGFCTERRVFTIYPQWRNRLFCCEKKNEESNRSTQPLYYCLSYKPNVISVASIFYANLSSLCVFGINICDIISRKYKWNAVFSLIFSTVYNTNFNLVSPDISLNGTL